MIKRLIAHPLIRQLFLFGIVGVIGFAVDASVLYGALYAGLGYYSGRVVSYISAATTTWYFNRSWTFKASAGSNKKAEWGRFLVLNLGGFAVNYGTYVVTISLLPGTSVPEAYIPLIGVAAGSIAGLFVNFTINKLFVFNTKA